MCATHHGHSPAPAVTKQKPPCHAAARETYRYQVERRDQTKATITPRRENNVRTETRSNAGTKQNQKPPSRGRARDVRADQVERLVDHELPAVLGRDYALGVVPRARAAVRGDEADAAGRVACRAHGVVPLVARDGLRRRRHNDARASHTHRRCHHGVEEDARRAHGGRSHHQRAPRLERRGMRRCARPPPRNTKARQLRGVCGGCLEPTVALWILRHCDPMTEAAR